MKGLLSLNAPEISFLQYKLEHFSLELPENRFKAGKFRFQNLAAENISGNFSEELKGSANFTAYGGKGNIAFGMENEAEQFAAEFIFNVKGLALADFVRALSDEVYIAGVLDINGKGAFGGGAPEVAVSFRSRPVKGVKQVMNFSAINVLASMGGGNPVKAIGSSNFGYRLIAGRLTVRDKHLTIEGMAGTRGRHNLLIKGGTFRGMNLSIDRESNTISMEEIKRRAAAATQSMKR